MKQRYENELTIVQLAALSDDEIDTSDIAELGEEFWREARVVMPPEQERIQITAKFDADMITWFKSQGRGYQARMNAVLRSFYEAMRNPN